MAYRSVNANHAADPCLVLCLVRTPLSREQPVTWLQAVPVLLCRYVHHTEAGCAVARLAGLLYQCTFFQALLGRLNTRFVCMITQKSMLFWTSEGSIS